MGAFAVGFGRLFVGQCVNSAGLKAEIDFSLGLQAIAILPGGWVGSEKR